MNKETPIIMILMGLAVMCFSLAILFGLEIIEAIANNELDVSANITHVDYGFEGHMVENLADYLESSPKADYTNTQEVKE